MERFLEFLTELLGADDPTVVALAARTDGDDPWADVSTDDLAAVRDGIRALADRDDVPLDMLRAAIDAGSEISDAIDGRADAEAAEARDALRALGADPEADEPEAEVEEPEAEPTVAEEPPAEEPAEEPETAPTADTEPAPEPEAQPEPARQPVAASTTQRRPATPARHRPQPTTPAGAPLVAAANVGDYPASHRFQSADELDRALVAAARHLGNGSRMVAAKANRQQGYGTDRRLTGDDSENTRLMMRAQEAAQNRARELIDRALWAQNPTSPEVRALVADGGVCAPAAPRYDFFEVGTTARPIRDALPSFDASRGRIVFTPPTHIDALNPGLTTITEDADAAGNTDKNVVQVACPTNTTVELQAIAKRLRVGNWENMFHPERVAHLRRALDVEFTRETENALWASIVADGTAVTDNEELSATRDILEAFGRYAAYFRDFYRLDDATVLRVLAPRGLKELMRGDLARQQPGDNTYAVTDAQFAQWFAARGVLVTWTNEANGTFEFTSGQGVGPVQGWPSTVDIEIFPEGSHLFLDGGMLDLGLVRDSTLNASNNLEFFAEVWEETAMIGHESWDVTLTICPSGITSGQNDSFDPCPPGS